MKISIALATYNGADYIGAQLDSFIAQSRPPDELVITDDQSTDATAAIVREFAERAPFSVRFESNPQRLGAMLNFDRALGLCTGDLVLLSDQDDVWLPEKIETLACAATRHPDMGCIINDALLSDASLHSSGISKMEQIKAAGLPATAMVQGCCAAFRRDFLDCLLPIPPSQQAHDNWLVQMADLLSQTVRLGKPLQYYRRHGGNISNFFVNRLIEPGYWQRVQARVADLVRRANDSGGLEQELKFNDSATERLTERQVMFATAIGVQKLQAAISCASIRSKVLTSRKGIRSMPRRFRLPHVLKLWRSGGYSMSGHFAGAAKDLLVDPHDKTGPQ